MEQELKKQRSLAPGTLGAQAKKRYEKQLVKTHRTLSAATLQPKALNTTTIKIKTMGSVTKATKASPLALTSIKGLMQDSLLISKKLHRFQEQFQNL